MLRLRRWPVARVHPSWGQSESQRAVGGEKTQVLCHLGRILMRFFHLIKSMSKFEYASWRLLPIELGMGSANSGVKEQALLLCTFSLSANRLLVEF